MLELKEQWNRPRKNQMCMRICASHEGRTRDPAVVPRRSSPLGVRQYKIDAVMHACSW